MNTIQETISTPVKDECDVFVAGGGFAGISSALSAAREGKRVILAERLFMLGGLATAGLVTIFLPLCDGEGHQVSYGICEELIKLAASESFNSVPKEWMDGAEYVEGKIYAGKCPGMYKQQTWVYRVPKDLLV